MAITTRSARLIVVIAGVLLTAYAISWMQVSERNIGRSDFTGDYVAGTLLREGHRSDLYDEALQAPLHQRLIAPDTEGNLPFAAAPLAAALAAPITLLDLSTAYRLWSLLMLGLLVAAVFIAAGAAPWPVATPRIWKVAAAGVALAGIGSWAELLQAQWTPVIALGLALAYRDWRNGHNARGATLLIIAVGVAKPHLALGLGAFLLGWRQRSVLKGAVAGALAVAAANLAVVGPSGVAGFVNSAVTSSGRWQLRTFISFVGIPGSYTGNGTAAQLVGAAGSVAACAVAWRLGAAVRRNPEHLSIGLAGAAVLSLLASPHALVHDLVLVAPAVAWSFARVLDTAPDGATAGRRVAALTGLAALLSVAAAVTLLDGAAAPLGALAPWALIVAAVVACREVWKKPSMPHRVPWADRETALGTLADGVH